MEIVSDVITTNTPSLTNISVRVSFMSHLNGLQSLEMMVPSCRLVQNQIQHVIEVNVLIPETLHLPVMVLFVGITQRGEYDSISRNINMEDLVGQTIPWLSQNFQLLCECN